MSYYYISHHGIKGQRWGVRRYQNKDGSYTNAGQKHRTDKKHTLTKGQKIAIGIGVGAGAATATYAISTVVRPYHNIGIKEVNALRKEKGVKLSDISKSQIEHDKEFTSRVGKKAGETIKNNTYTMQQNLKNRRLSKGPQYGGLDASYIPEQYTHMKLKDIASSYDLFGRVMNYDIDPDMKDVGIHNTNVFRNR